MGQAQSDVIRLVRPEDVRRMKGNLDRFGLTILDAEGNRDKKGAETIPLENLAPFFPVRHEQQFETADYLLGVAKDRHAYDTLSFAEGVLDAQERGVEVFPSHLRFAHFPMFHAQSRDVEQKIWIVEFLWSEDQESWVYKVAPLERNYYKETCLILPA